MIWFSCKQCGKVHGRSENSIGTMIFCDCGTGLTVPWESTAAEPEKRPEAPAFPGPVLKPMVFDSGPPPLPARSERIERTEPLDRPLDRPLERSERDRGERWERERPAPRRDRRGPRDPNSCLNHEGRIKQNTCALCNEGFCAWCVVSFEGKMMCGPCKNLQARLLQKPLRVSSYAWVSVLLAFALGPLTLFLPLGAWSWAVLWVFLALLPQAAAVLFGALAWRQVEENPNVGGRGMAFGGMLGGAVVALLLVVMNIYATRWHG